MSIEKYEKLEKQGEKWYGKLDEICAKMFHLIDNMVDPDIMEDASVFRQTGDGFVLSWGSFHNTPVDAIINTYNGITRLYRKDLLRISI